MNLNQDDTCKGEESKNPVNQLHGGGLLDGSSLIKLVFKRKCQSVLKTPQNQTYQKLVLKKSISLKEINLV